MSTQEQLNDYDSEPVRYCARCYSLKVKYDESIDSEYCVDCGSSDIAESSIDEWEKKFERRYNCRYVVKNEDPQQSFLFNLPIEKLKTKVYNSPHWKEIINRLYPHFPGGLSRTDSIILLFDKLVKDNKLKDLKLMLMKYFKY